MVKFTKLTKFHYFAENADGLIKKADELVNELSNGKKTDFIEESNIDLFHAILSRLISVEFFKHNDLQEDVLTALVDVTHNGETYTTSLGTMPDFNKDGKVKIVSSYYIM